MLNKRDYFIYFIRLFFIGLIIEICSLISYFWKIYQPFRLILQWQQCQSSLSNINDYHYVKIFHWSNLFPSLTRNSSISCYLSLKNEYPIDVIQYIVYIRSIFIIYFIYHLISFALFHNQLKQLQMKQNHYGYLYRINQKRKDENYRCSKSFIVNIKHDNNHLV